MALSTLLLDKIKLYGMLILGVAVIAAGIWVYNLYKENQRLQFQTKEDTQNAAALRDSLGQQRGQIVQAAVFVRDLNTALEQKQHDYIALQGHIQAFLDSISAHGNSSPIVKGDSITVPFSGTKGIADFSGYTTYNGKDHSSSWFFDIGFPRPILAGVTLRQHGEIWEFVIQSLTPGCTVMGGGDLDLDTYARLQKYAPAPPMNRYMIGLSIGQHGGPALGYRMDKWNLTAHYDLFDKDPVVLKNIYLDIMWCPF